MSEPGAWVIVPAFNEAAVVGAVVRALVERGHAVVVVDDASTDRTAEAVRGAGAHLCRHAVNLGQGAALQTGIRYALANGARYVATFDADGQHGADDVERLVAPLASGEFDVALGTRFADGARAIGMPPARAALLRLAAARARLAFGVRVTDAHNGLRAFTAAAAAVIDIRQNRMAHADEILHQVRLAGLRYTEVPVTVRYTPYSLAKGQRAGDSINILWDSFTGLFRK